MDTSKIDTLAEVLGRPLGDSTSGEEVADLCQKATELNRTAATATIAADVGLGKVCPVPILSPHTALGVEEAEQDGDRGGDRGTTGGVVGTVMPEAAGLEVAGVVGTGFGGLGQQRPGQRALLRLRKKCDAGAGE